MLNFYFKHALNSEEWGKVALIFFGLRNIEKKYDRNRTLQL